MNIIFDEVGHTYTDGNGNIIPSVTQILGKVYGTGLEDAPRFFVERAAEKGTAIHKEIEAYLKTGKQGESQEFKAWLSWFAYGNKALFREWGSEKIIYASTKNGAFAGTLDFWGDGWIYDWKTCKTATKQQIEKWQKQLSFYCYAVRRMGNPVNEPLKIMHLTADTYEVINVEYLGDDFVEETMAHYRAGESVIPVTCTELQTVSQEELMVLEETLRMIDTLKEKAQQIREKIQEEMEKRGLLSVAIGPVRASYVAGSVKHTFDTKRFKAEHADLYKDYLTNSTVKPSVRITITED